MDSNYTVSGAKRFWDLTVAKTNSDNKPQKTRQCYRESTKNRSRRRCGIKIAPHESTAVKGLVQRLHGMELVNMIYRKGA